MQKLFYLLFDDPSNPGGKLREALIGTALPEMRASGARDITLFVADEDVEAGTPLRHHDPPIRGGVSFWLDDAADRFPSEKVLSGLVPRIAGYLVLESRPMVHDMPKGERTPGMKQMTCITKQADISQEEFIHIWHGYHRDVAIETQSTFGYVRNEIFRALTPDAPDVWDAIVEESFPIGALTDPKVFYDAKDDAELKANLDRMMESCDRFLDRDPLEFTFVSEYYCG